jgi:hypothetical protein
MPPFDNDLIMFKNRDIVYFYLRLQLIVKFLTLIVRMKKLPNDVSHVIMFAVFLLYRPKIYAILANFVLNFPFGYTQDRRRLRLVSACILQDFFDNVPLEGFNYFFKAVPEFLHSASSFIYRKRRGAAVGFYASFDYKTIATVVPI